MTTDTAHTNEVTTDTSSGDVRRGLSERARINLIRFGSLLVLLVLWELIGRATNPLVFTYPSAIVAATGDMIADGTLPFALAQSLLIFAIGMGIGTVGGIAIGLVMGRSRIVSAIADIPIVALYATPMVALVPVLVLIFGFGVTAKIVVVTLFTIFPVLMNTARGVREVDPQLIEVTRAFCSPERYLWKDLILPSALPYIVTGIRLAIGRGLVGIIIAEFYTSVSGLGFLIVSNANQFETARVFVPIVVLMILGVGLTKALEVLEHVLAPWQTQR